MNEPHMPPQLTIEVTQQMSLADLITKLPYGYVSRYEWSVLNVDLAKRDGQLEACGVIMGRDRKVGDLVVEALRACEKEFGRHNLPESARTELKKRDK